MTIAGLLRNEAFVVGAKDSSGVGADLDALARAREEEPWSLLVEDVAAPAILIVVLRQKVYARGVGRPLLVQSCRQLPHRVSPRTPVSVRMSSSSSMVRRSSSARAADGAVSARPAQARNFSSSSSSLAGLVG
jgi:hypothetical protein